MSTAVHARSFAALMILTVAVVPRAHAQHAVPERVKEMYGCWSVETGPFTPGPSGRTDPGQTVLPPLIALDSVRGNSWTGDAVGWRVHSYPGASGTRYRDGYYTISDTNRIEVNWTNGVVGITMLVRADSLVMRGTAEAWTDYMARERANVTLRRASECALDAINPH